MKTLAKPKTPALTKQCLILVQTKYIKKKTQWFRKGERENTIKINIQLTFARKLSSQRSLLTGDCIASSWSFSWSLNGKFAASHSERSAAASDRRELTSASIKDCEMSTDFINQPVLRMHQTHVDIVANDIQTGS